MFELYAALLLSAQGAAPPEPAPSEDIVVTGRRPMTQSEVKRHVGEISLTAQGQLARFALPICPKAIGLPPEYAEVVEARIRELAVNARLDVARAPCASNVTLIVTTDGRQFVDQVRSTRIFGDLEPWEIRRIRDSSPVRVWNRTQLVNEDFQAIKGNVLTVKSASIVTQTTQQVIMEAFVLIDSSAVAGKSLVQLADYVAMRTLAETRAPRSGAPAADTILALFEPGSQAPDQATALDLAYLDGLYRAAANRRFTQQRARISKLIGRELKGEAP